MLARTTLLGVPRTTLKHPKYFKSSPTPAVGHSSLTNCWEGAGRAQHAAAGTSSAGTNSNHLVLWSYRTAKHKALGPKFKAHICIRKNISNVMKHTKAQNTDGMLCQEQMF